MSKYLIFALVALLAWAWWHGELPANSWLHTSSEPAPVYRWKDEKGQLVYGEQPPAGKKAERVRASERMSVVEAPPAKLVKPPAKPQAENLKEKMMDRAVEGAP